MRRTIITACLAAAAALAAGGCSDDGGEAGASPSSSETPSTTSPSGTDSDQTVEPVDNEPNSATTVTCSTAQQGTQILDGMIGMFYDTGQMNSWTAELALEDTASMADPLPGADDDVTAAYLALRQMSANELNTLASGSIHTFDLEDLLTELQEACDDAGAPIVYPGG